MADDDRATGVLRAGLIELAKDVPMRVDLVERVIDAAHSTTASPTRRRATRRWVAPLAAAAVVAAAAAAVVVATARFEGAPPPAGHLGKFGPVSSWDTYTSPAFGFSVKYPSAWQPYPTGYGHVSFNFVVNLSSYRLPAACTTSEGGAYVWCGVPVLPLRAGDVVIQWEQETEMSPGSYFRGWRGRRTLIDGHQASVSVGVPTTTTPCAQSNGTRQIDIAIADRPTRRVMMTACLAGSGDQLRVSTDAVLASARSVRLFRAQPPPVPSSDRTLPVSSSAAPSKPTQRK